MIRRILVIDDHVAIQRGLEEILANSFKGAEYGLANNAQQALGELRKARWDVAILDLSLPGRGGLDLIRELKDEQPRLAVLVYSMHAEDRFGVRALRAGADGYLTKDSPVEEIPKAIRMLLEGGRYISPNLASLLAQTVTHGATEPHQLLSDREYQVLRSIASGKSPTEIAEGLALSIKTVSTYRVRILEKLSLETTADLIRYAIEHHLVE